jgi:hypothetical protein
LWQPTTDAKTDLPPDISNRMSSVRRMSRHNGVKRSAALELPQKTADFEWATPKATPHRATSTSWEE